MFDLILKPSVRSHSFHFDIQVSNVKYVVLISQLDSLFGATLQRTLVSTQDGRIVTDHSASTVRGRIAIAKGQVKQVGFGLDVLSNSGVNMVCTCIMAILGWSYGTLR